jgi:hypothetical protein
MNKKQILYAVIGLALCIVKLGLIIMNLPVFLANWGLDLLLDLTMYFYERESK